MSLSNLINHLQNKTLFDHEVNSFRVIETHISCVLLTGHYAYKFKKSLNLGFLDFSTLEKRHHFLNCELRLNQFFSDDTYEAVLPVYGSDEAPRFQALTPDEQPFEYTLKMREFPQDQLFAHLLNINALNLNYILAFAEQLADFHHRSELTAAESDFGNPDHIYAPVVQNFEQMADLLKKLPAEHASKNTEIDLLKEAEAWAVKEHQRLLPSLIRRKSQGHIRACHGDVHLNNIVLLNQKPVLFDCIEFNDDLRFTDTMADVAFLTMDLADRKHTRYAHAALNRYLEISGDFEGLEVLRYYQHYRAMVRAKIALFRLEQPLTLEESKILINTYRNYMNLAAQYMKPTPRFVCLMYGLSASGKSVRSAAIAEYTGAIRIRSDLERKRLHNIPLSQNTTAALLDGAYAPERTEDLYQHLLSLSTNILNAGYAVIIDATFLYARHRALFIELAKAENIPYLIIDCQAPLSVLEKRLENRQHKTGQASEAYLDVLHSQHARCEPLSAEETSRTIVSSVENKDFSEKLLYSFNQLIG